MSGGRGWHPRQGSQHSPGPLLPRPIHPTDFFPLSPDEPGALVGGRGSTQVGAPHLSRVSGQGCLSSPHTSSWEVRGLLQPHVPLRIHFCTFTGKPTGISSGLPSRAGPFAGADSSTALGLPISRSVCRSLTGLPSGLPPGDQALHVAMDGGFSFCVWLSPAGPSHPMSVVQPRAPRPPPQAGNSRGGKSLLLPQSCHLPTGGVLQAWNPLVLSLWVKNSVLKIDMGLFRIFNSCVFILKVYL